MVKIHKVKITILKRFHPSEVFKTSPVTSETPFGACEHFKNEQEFIQKVSAIQLGCRSTIMYDC